MKRLISFAAAVGMLFITACGEKENKADMSFIGSMELKYAEQFSVDYCENGCSVVTIGDDRFLIVPELRIFMLRQLLQWTYLTA